MKLIRNFIGALALIGLGLPAFASQQLVNVGAAANDGTGDPARTAFQKINANFTDLYTFLYAPLTGPVTTVSGSNLTTIGNSVLTNAMFANMPAQTVKCNFSVSAAPPVDCTIAQMQTLLGTGGASGTGTLTNFSLTMPSMFSVTGSPLSTDGSTIAVNFASGLPANQFLATPNGSNGSIALRSLAAGDMPSFTGNVTSVGGVNTIAPNAVTNAMQALMAAGTIKCNPLGSAAAVQDCNAATVNTMLGTTGGGGGGAGLSNQVDGCTFPGVDATGVNDSVAGIRNAFLAVAGTGKELVINCPIRLVIGNDITKPIFVHDGTNLRFGAGGQFIVDNAGVPVFVFLSTQNITWTDPKFQYVGSLPVAVENFGGAFTDGPMKTYMLTFLGNTFLPPAHTSGALFSGPTNNCAILHIVGSANHLKFIRLKAFVADGADVSTFIPTVVAMDPNWSPGVGVVDSNVVGVNATNFSMPNDLTFIDPVFDGYYMGFVGGANNLTVMNPVFLRYGDLVDSSGNNQGGVGTWFAPPHAMYMNEGDPSFGAKLHIVNGYDAGIYSGPALRRTTVSGFLNSIKADVSNGGTVDGWTSLRPDGAVLVVNANNNPVGGSVRNVVAVINSQITAVNGQPASTGGLGFPNDCYSNISVENFTIIDTAAAPTSFPAGMSQVYSCNTNVSATNIKVFLNDWTNTLWPAPTMSGNNLTWQSEVFFNQYSTTQGMRGVIGVQGLNLCTNCNIDVKVQGWMLRPVVFSAAIASGATTLPPLATSWVFGSGMYAVNFPSGETRNIALTQNSSAVGAAFPALVSAEPAAGATAIGALASNFPTNKNRILLAFQNGSVGSRGHVSDVTNGYEGTAENGILTEYWTQRWMGTPTGASQSTGMVFLPAMASDVNSVLVNTALGAGPTSFNIGWSGNLTALRSAVGVTAGTNPTGPIGTAVPFPNNPTTIVLTPVGGNFGTTGSVSVSVRGEQVSAAQ